MKRRRLSDVYKPGVAVTFNDGISEIQVWVQKLSPVDHEAAVRKANAARARQIMAARDTDSEDYQAIWSDVQTFPNTDVLVDLLVDDKLAERRSAIEAQVGAEDEWSEDNYLQGLFDAWNDGMLERWLADNEDPEAKRIYDELQRFNAQVAEIYQGEYDEERATITATGRDNIVDASTQYFIERRGASAFLAEYQRAQIYYATREADNHRSYYFSEGGFAEVDDLSEEVRRRLLDAYESVSVDPIEGKGSGETQPSSTSSEPPVAEETQASSTQPALAQ